MPITTTGFQKLESKLKRVSIPRMGEIIIKGNKENFNRSRNNDGSTMSPISQERIAYKKRIGARFPRKPLIFTEQLMNAMEARQLNPNQGQVSMLDKLRSGGITNTGILNIQKKFNRSPFGIRSSLVPLRRYLKSVYTSE